VILDGFYGDGDELSGSKQQESLNKYLLVENAVSGADG
jgi:hypothetical protein